MLKRPLSVLATLAAVSLLASCGDDSSTDTASEPTPSETTTSSASASPSAGDATGACTYAEDGAASKEVDLPPAQPTVEGTVSATMTTSIGDLGLELDAAAAPCTVGSFVSLAEQGYFDGSTCHRLTTADSGISVLQCGDPDGTGMGGPGYTVPDELTGSETYGPGTLAMANTGAPDTGGSQFFVVYGDTPLPPQYTVFGTIDKAGLKAVKEAAADGTVDGGPDGAPATAVDIETVTVG